MFLNKQQFSEEIKGEIKKYLETKDNENMIIQNLQDAAKAVLRGKFIVVQSYLKTQEILNKQPNFTSKATKARRKKKQKSKLSRRKQIKKITSGINEPGKGKQQQRSM